MLLGLRIDMRSGYHHDDGDPYESAANSERMRLHTEDEDMHVLFGASRGACFD